MIGKLTGKRDEVYEDCVIIDVSGVGYEILASAPTLSQIRTSVNPITSLFIQTHVREDHIHLYGFLSLEEKTAFNILQTVSGIGAKVALSILSYLSPEQIQTAIDMKDKAAFCAVSGIGPKMAERILLELKGKKFSSNTSSIQAYTKDSSLIEDASTALFNLGLNKQESINLVKNILQNSPNASIDEVIRSALQNRAK